jgi:hypothetical protein
MEARPARVEAAGVVGAKVGKTVTHKDKDAQALPREETVADAAGLN